MPNAANMRGSLCTLGSLRTEACERAGALEADHAGADAAHREGDVVQDAHPGIGGAVSVGQFCSACGVRLVFVCAVRCVCSMSCQQGSSCLGSGLRVLSTLIARAVTENSQRSWGCFHGDTDHSL